MKSHLRALLFSILACIFMMQVQAGEPPKAVPEFTMKAAYLYNFAQLTEWPTLPESSAEPFNLCVYGEGELSYALELLRGRMINRHPLRLLRVMDAAEAKPCHLLFIGEGEVGQGGRLLTSLKGAPVLTVTDDLKLARSGAMLVIIPEARRLAFEANVGLARHSQLKFSSKLLALARKVSDE
jgi:hypothetical protein